MKYRIDAPRKVKAEFSFDRGHEEVFVECPTPEFVRISQDGDCIELPASDFRAFLKALSEWADEAGIAQVQS